MGNLQNKTPPTHRRGSNEETSGDGGRILGIPVIVEPVVVMDPLTTIPVQIPGMEVASRVAEHAKYLPKHYPSNTLQTEFYTQYSIA